MKNLSCKIALLFIVLILAAPLLPPGVRASPAFLYFHYRNEGPVSFLGLTGVYRTLNLTVGQLLHEDSSSLTTGFRERPVSNMNFTGAATGWATTTSVTSGTATYGYDSATGNPAPGSGAGSYYHKATSTAAKAADITFTTETSFTFTYGTPDSARLSYAYTLGGNSFGTGMSLIVRLVKPDLTTVDLDTVSLPAAAVAWTYRRDIIVDPTHFTQSGTYKLRVVNRLVTAVKGTANYVQLNFDDIGILLYKAPNPSFSLDFYFYPELAESWTPDVATINAYLYLKESVDIGANWNITVAIYERSSTASTLWTWQPLTGQDLGTAYALTTVSWTPSAPNTFDAYNTIHVRVIFRNPTATISTIYFAYDTSTYNSRIDIPAPADPIPIPEFLFFSSLGSALTAFGVFLRKSLGRVEKKIRHSAHLLRIKGPTVIKHGIKTHYRIFIIAGAIIIAYHRDFIALWNGILVNDYMRYIAIVPIISAYLVYRKRHVLRAIAQAGNGPSFSQELIALALCLFAFSLYFYGTFSFFELQFHLLSLILFLAGGVLLFYGLDGLRALAFPIAYLGLMIPLPLNFIVWLVAQSMIISAHASSFILSIFQVPVTLDTSQAIYTIDLISRAGEPLSFLIGIPCAGIQSLLGYLAFGVFLAYIVKASRIKKMAIFFAGCLTVYTLNIVRITLIIALAYFFGKGLAVEVFHLFGGWVIVAIATLATMAYASMKGPKISIPATITRVTLPRARMRTTFKTIALLGIVSLFFFTNVAWMVAPRFEPGYIMLRSLDDVSARSLLPSEFSDWELRYVRPILVHTGQNATHMYKYALNGRDMVTVYVEVTSHPSLLHFVWTWPICMPILEGWVLKASWDIMLSESPYVKGRVFIFDAPKQGITPVIVTFTTDLFGQVGASKIVAPVGISLLGYAEGFASVGAINDPKDYTSAAGLLKDLGKNVIDYWQQFRLKSWPMMVTYSLFANIETLTAFYAILLVIGAVVVSIRSDMKNITLRRGLRYLSWEEKLSMLSLSTQRKIVKKFGEEDPMTKTLYDLEKKGLAKRRIASIHDEPFIFWKPSPFVTLEKIKPSARLELRTLRRSYGLPVSLVLISLSVTIFYVASSMNSLMWSGVSAMFLILGIAPLVVSLEGYLRLDIAGKSVLSPLLAVKDLLLGLNVTGPAVYVPPTGDVPEGRIFLPFKSAPRRSLPRPSELDKSKVVILDKGISIPPIGNEILSSIENELGASLESIDIEELTKVLPAILVEKLELADRVDMKRSGDMVSVSMERPRFSNLCKELGKTDAIICGAVGCPVCSSLATALAKSTGRYVWLEDHAYDERQDLTYLCFRLGERSIHVAPSIPSMISTRIDEISKLGKVSWLGRRKRSLPGIALLTLSIVATATAFITKSLLTELVVITAFSVGFLISYIALEIKVRASLTSQAIVSSLNTLSRLLSQAGIAGRGTYLPTGRTVIPLKGGNLIMPSVGGELVSLIHKELGGVSLDTLVDRLPIVLTEKLDLAKEVSMKRLYDTIKVRIRGSKFAYICDNLRKGPKPSCEAFGCPLCSAIGIAIADYSGRPVRLGRHSYNPFKDVIFFEFKLQ